MWRNWTFAARSQNFETEFEVQIPETNETNLKN